MSDYIIGLGSFDLDARDFGSEGRYANDYHGIAKAPNCEYAWRTLKTTGLSWIELRALAPIAPGEEVLVDYGPSWWDEKNKAVRCVWRARVLVHCALACFEALFAAAEMRCRCWAFVHRR
jgi:SET domain-containing protein